MKKELKKKKDLRPYKYFVSYHFYEDNGRSGHGMIRMSLKLPMDTYDAYVAIKQHIEKRYFFGGAKVVIMNAIRLKK